MEMSEQTNELFSALAKAQAEMRPARKNATNPHLRNTYADLQDVVDACRPALTKHGLAIFQTTDETESGAVLVTTLTHASGQWVRGRLRINPTDAKGLNSNQAFGSALSYARRYAISSIAGVVTSDDDDAVTASHPTISAEQVQAIRQRLQETGSDEARFMKWAKVGSLDAILASNYDACISAINAAAKAKGGNGNAGNG